MARYTMIIDTRKCIGCFACHTACQQQNELPIEQSFIRFEDEESGKFPQVKYVVVPLQCQHCAYAPCVSVCPTTASHKAPDGRTLVDKEKCMGCKRCMTACPYNSRIYLEQEGVVQACNLCMSLVLEGEEPACVTTCLTKARIFGDLDNPKGDFAKLLTQTRLLRADFGTHPTLLYIK